MAKKSNRPKAKPAARQQPAAVEEPVEIVEEAVSPTVEAAAAEPRPRRVAKRTRSQTASEELEEQYAYIVSDLRRVFILAGVMFALLIVANIVIDLVAG